MKGDDIMSEQEKYVGPNVSQMREDMKKNAYPTPIKKVPSANNTMTAITKSGTEPLTAIIAGVTQPVTDIAKGASKTVTAIDKKDKKDRSNSKYSEDDFMAMPRNKQFELAQKYWGGAVADFDDGTFQFSVTHFKNLCERLGFTKGVVDTRAGLPVDTVKSNSGIDTIYIERGIRENTGERKFTLSKQTLDNLNEFFEPSEKARALTSMEKSKIIDSLFNQMLENKLKSKREGKLKVTYKLTDERDILT